MRLFNHSCHVGHRSAQLAFAALLAVPSALQAQGSDILFIDGGYAEICASAAFNAEHSAAVQMTGSRLAVEGMEICTWAIDSGESTPAQRAASHNNRGVLLFSAGRIEEALRDFEAALALDETLGAAHVNRGYCLTALKRWQDSLAAFDRGITLGAPEPERAHFSRAIAHEELGHVREAYFDYRKASELKPDWADPQRELSRFVVKTR